jgi:circadian clock protein KaiB
MAKKSLPSVQSDDGRSGREPNEAFYELRLYGAGLTPQSQRAIKHVNAICREHLAGRYQLQVIDIYQQPVLAKGEQIIAVPTLIKHLPHPLRKLIGNMADADKVLVGLDLRPKAG